MSVRIIQGDCREVLRTLPDESVHCVVTSPPYWGLRDYGTGKDGIGLEDTLQEHIANLRDVFAEVRRVLRKDGTLWVNYGDAYATSPNGNTHLTHDGRYKSKRDDRTFTDKPFSTIDKGAGLKAKDLIGLPWRLAFALQDDGWWLRSDIIWAKPNPMPESVKDRPTKAHEYIFLLAKSERYWYDADAIAEAAVHGELYHGAYAPLTGSGEKRTTARNGRESVPRGGFNGKTNALPGREAFRAITETRNARTVWNIATEPYPDAHFATFPTELAERCIKAGCPTGGTVLDPFGGAGTVGLVADRLQRNAILIELNPTYAEMAERRIRSDAPMFSEVSR